MRFAALLFFILVGLFAFSSALPAKGSTKASLKKKPCLKDCGGDYKPVCAGDGKDKPKSFGSECVLQNYNCENSQDWKVVSQGECPGGGGVRLS